MVEHCLAVDGLGFQIFNVSNDTHSVVNRTEELCALFYEGVPLLRLMWPDESLYSNAKAREKLGFAPGHERHRLFDAD